MEQSSTVYDLLPLTWWENPWFLLLIAGGSILIIILFVSVYFYWKKGSAQEVPPEQLALHSVSALKKAVLKREVSSEDYAELVGIIREYLLTRYGVGAVAATDQEFLGCIRERKAIFPKGALPEEFTVVVLTIMNASSEIKFGSRPVPNEEFLKYLESLTKYIIFLNDRSEENLQG